MGLDRTTNPTTLTALCWFDIVLLGVLVRLIIGAAKIGLSRGSEPTKQSDESEV